MRFVLPFAVVGCLVATASSASAQRGGGGPPTYTTRDSAGILIVENQRPMWTATQNPRVSPTADLVIGDRTGAPYEFRAIKGVARLKDGRIVVVDGSSRQLRFFDSTGTFINAVGRQGDGPGEMRDIFMVTLLADDTIAISGQTRTSIFTGAGHFVTSLRLQAPPIKMPAGIRLPMGVLSTNARVVTSLTNPEPRARGESWVHQAPVVFVDSNNAVIADLGLQPSMEITMASIARPPWLGAGMAMTTDRDVFYIGYGGEYAITTYGLDGKPRTIVRRVWTPHRITPAEKELFATEWGKRWIKSTGEKAEADLRDLRNDPHAERLPAFSQMMVDQARRLWVREPNVVDAAWAGGLNDVPLAPSRWSVFDERGRWFGVVTLPARFMPMYIGWDYVLGVQRDDDDVETVVRYRLRSGNPG